MRFLWLFIIVGNSFCFFIYVGVFGYLVEWRLRWGFILICKCKLGLDSEDDVCLVLIGIGMCLGWIGSVSNIFSFNL